MRRHHDGGAAGVDAEKELHDLPRGRGVEVAGGLVGDDETRRVHQGARDGDPLLLATRQVGGVGQLLPDRPTVSSASATRDLDLVVGLAQDAQRESDVLVDVRFGRSLKSWKTRPTLRR